MSCFSMGFVEQDLINLDLRSKEKAIQVNSKRYTMLSSGHTRPYNDIDDYNQPYKSMKGCKRPDQQKDIKCPVVLQFCKF